jgi:phosphomannomutase
MIMTVNEKVFKAYDIRGLYPNEVNEELAYRVGKAFAQHLKCKHIAIGKDMRNSSQSLFDALAKGLTEMGADVTDIGMCTTPLLNFSVAHYKLDGGIMISASHNPGKYNAFKMIAHPALQMGAGSGMEEIKELVLKDDFPESEKKGSISAKDVLDDYLNHVKKFCSNIKGLKIVADYGNGVGALSAKPLFDSLPVEVTHLYPEPDGTFPNHEANPHDISNFKDLQEKVKEQGADIGIFFDGDADRSAIVNEKGELVFPDIVLGIITEHKLANYDDKRVYFDLRFTNAIKEVIESKGGRPIMMRVGNPFYKEKLIKEGGAFGGEFSGHIMFSDNYCIDDGLFAAVMLLDIVCSTGKKVSELAAPLQKYFQSPEINKKVDDADAVLAEAESAFSDGEGVDIDGVRIRYPDWWFSLRKSNTEPLVRLRVEANTKDLLDEKLGALLEIIKKHEQ